MMAADTNALSMDEQSRRQWQDTMMNNYGTPPLTIVAGEGTHVTDSDGKVYLDLLAGIAVNALGHAHPAIVEAVSTQVRTLGHTSNLVITRPVVDLAERLLHILSIGRQDTGRVFFCNSGAEANEAAFKLSRLTGRSTVIVAQDSFHGRTMGALALTAQPGKADPFRPLPGDVGVVPFGDVEALERAVDDSVAAVFLEPIQGEGGVIPAPPGYLAAARRITAQHGALLILDEVQSGIGRTGFWFAHQAEGVHPDVVTIAKGLGGGLPIGACVAFGPAAQLLGPGTHGTTFGGNPISCAAAMAVIETIENDDLLAHVRVMSDRLRSILLESDLVTEVRGQGLLLGAVLSLPLAAGVEASAREKGFIVNAVRPDVVRFAPPLIISDADLDELERSWNAVCTDAMMRANAGGAT
jgi:acetylornithine/N-succinyldiaminopimelate aminotransferase